MPTVSHYAAPASGELLASLQVGLSARAAPLGMQGRLPGHGGGAIAVRIVDAVWRLA